MRQRCSQLSGLGAGKGNREAECAQCRLKRGSIRAVVSSDPLHCIRNWIGFLKLRPHPEIRFILSEPFHLLGGVLAALRRTDGRQMIVSTASHAPDIACQRARSARGVVCVCMRRAYNSTEATQEGAEALLRCGIIVCRRGRILLRCCQQVLYSLPVADGLPGCRARHEHAGAEQLCYLLQQAAAQHGFAAPVDFLADPAPFADEKEAPKIELRRRATPLTRPREGTLRPTAT